MHITLAPPVEKALQERLDSGLYADANDVLASALSILASVEDEAFVRIRRRNKEAWEGYLRGEAIPVEDVMAELEAKYGDALDCGKPDATNEES